MNRWSEENFLDRLMPSLRQKNDPERSPCPDAETLSAILDGECGDFIRNAVAEHLLSCLSCSGLHERLLHFDTSHVKGAEADWARAEKLLDNWIKGFLLDRETSSQSRRDSESGALARPAKGPRRFAWQWHLEWVGGLATAAILLVTGTAVVVRHITLTQTPVQTARPAPIIEASPPSTLVPQVPGAVVPPINPVRPPNLTNGAARVSKKTIPLGKANQASETANATTTTPLASTSPQLANPRDTSGANNGTPVQTAQTDTSTSPNLQGNGPLSSGPPLGVTTRTSGNRASGERGVTSPQQRSATRGSVQSLPAAIRLAADTTLLILLDRETPQTDGSIIFHGSLIDPVPQSGAIVLSEKTEVIGFTMRNSGELLIYVEEFIVHGTTYKLKGSPVAGSMTELENGKIRETRLTETCVYEKTAIGSGQTPPHE